MQLATEGLDGTRWEANYKYPEERDVETTEMTPSVFTTDNSKQFISKIQDTVDFIQEIDPERERSASVRRGFKVQLYLYEVYMKKGR